MQSLTTRAHLPAVRFAPRAYMGCGAWDLAQAPEMAIPSMDSPRRSPVGSSLAFSRPRRTMGCSGRGYGPDDEETQLSCGGGGYQPEFMKEEDDGPIVTLKPGLSGRARRPQLGCGDEPCEECKAKMEKQMGCLKCKRIRQRAMMNQDEDEMQGARRMGQVPTLPDTSVLLVSGLAVAGLFYLATR